MEEAEKNCTYFYIRIDESQSLRDAIKDIPETEWKPALINNKKVEIADTPFFPFNGKKAYRAIVQRRKRKDEQFDIFTGSPYAYYAIMTNNETPIATNLYVTQFYNQRGDSKETSIYSTTILIVIACLSLFLMLTWFTSLPQPSALLCLSG